MSKNRKFLKIFSFGQKKMLSSYLSNIRRTRFNQSSPVHLVSESRGGSTNLTDGEGQTKEILVSNIGYLIASSSRIFFEILYFGMISPLPFGKNTNRSRFFLRMASLSQSSQDFYGIGATICIG